LRHPLNSRVGDLLDLAVSQDIVEKSGSWYSYEGERIGQGRENAKTFLKEHNDITTDIAQKVRLGFGLPAPTSKPAPEKEKAKKK
jgi:recombination protein RecA